MGVGFTVGVLGALLLLHAGYLTTQHRGMLKIMDEEFSGPTTGVVIELLLGLVLCMVAGFAGPGKFHSILPDSEENRVMVNPRLTGLSATWESNEVMIFCDLCIKEIGLGNRPTTHFSKEGWKNLIDEFKQRTGKTYNKLQMKNKWDHLKKDWKMWKELRLGHTCLGWDLEKRTIAASDQWWEDKIKAVPAVKKFCHAGISPELEEKMDIMFSQVVVRGEESWAASMGGLPADLQETPAQEQIHVEGNDDEFIGGNASVSNVRASGSKRRNIGKKKGVAHSFMSSLHESTVSLKPPPVATIKDAVEVIASMNEIRGDTGLYYFALNHITERSKREVFMSIPKKDRVWWIRSAYENRGM